MPNHISIYTQLIIDEAVKKNIVVSTFGETSPNIVTLTLGDHTEIIDQSLTNKLGAASSKLIGNKAVCNKYLLDHGFPAPAFIYTNDTTEAQAFLEQCGRVVVKPIGQTGGVGITANITTAEALTAAVATAQQYTRSIHHHIVCQEHIVGNDHRLLVIDYKHIFGIKRVPAYITGNGKDTAEQLIDGWNKSLPFPNRQIPKNGKTAHFLENAGFTMQSIIPADQRVTLSDVANSHAGGISEDVTDRISPQLKTMLIAVCKSLTIPVAGIDIISNDIGSDLGKIIEINVQPGLTIHHFPTLGQPRNPAEKIVELLFPEANNAHATL